MATARNYSNTASQASLSAAIASTDTSITLTNFTGYPAAPFTAALARGTANEEIVLVTAVSSNTATVTRGYDGTTAKAQGAGTTFQEVAVALDFRDANAHVVATAGVHGVTGSVVGTSDVQTLSNKTLTSPSSTNPTDSGTSTIATAQVTTLNVSGVSTLTGNATVGGTLGVTGATTLSTLGVTGATTLASAQVAATPAAAADVVRKDYADGLVAQATGSRKWTSYFGSVSAFPTTNVLAGDTCYRSDWLAPFQYDGTAWRQTDDAKMTKAQRTALTTASLPAGFRVYETDTGDRPVWNASSSTWDNVWVTYTPTWAAASASQSIGNGTVTGAYRKMGRRVEVQITLAWGTTTNGGTGAFAFGIPFTSANREQNLLTKAFCAGGNFGGVAYITASTATANPLLPISQTNNAMLTAQNASSGGAAGTGVPAVTSRFTFDTAGHNLLITGTYESAA